MIHRYIEFYSEFEFVQRATGQLDKNELGKLRINKKENRNHGKNK